MYDTYYAMVWFLASLALQCLQVKCVDSVECKNLVKWHNAIQNESGWIHKALVGCVRQKAAHNE